MPSIEEVSPDWSIDNVRVTCADQTLCPSNAGVLFVVQRNLVRRGSQWERHILLERCTASIYNLHGALTAGHCLDHLAVAKEIWFKSAALPGRPSRTFHAAAKPLARQVTADNWAMDYGAVELQEAATGIEFVRPPKQIPLDQTSEMIALVINAQTRNPLGDTLRLDPIPCRHGANTLDPFTYEMNPDKFLISYCSLVRGNSGGAVVLARDPHALVGIVAASNLARSPQPGLALVTNARCFSAPGWPQTESRCLELNEARVRGATEDTGHKQAIATLRHRLAAWIDSDSSRIKAGAATVVFLPEPVRIQYSDRSGNANTRQGYALMPVPFCLEGELPHTEDTRLKLAAQAFGSAYQDERLGTVSFKATFKAAGPGKYLVRYENRDGVSGNYRFSWMPLEESMYQEIASTGSEVELPTCMGNEKKNFLESFDKSELLGAFF